MSKMFCCLRVSNSLRKMVVQECPSETKQEKSIAWGSEIHKNLSVIRMSWDETIKEDMRGMSDNHNSIGIAL